MSAVVERVPNPPYGTSKEENSVANRNEGI